jgi:hypothetical protein
LNRDSRLFGFVAVQIDVAFQVELGGEGLGAGLAGEDAADRIDGVPLARLPFFGQARVQPGQVFAGAAHFFPGVRIAVSGGWRRRCGEQQLLMLMVLYRLQSNSSLLVISFFGAESEQELDGRVVLAAFQNVENVRNFGLLGSIL